MRFEIRKHWSKFKKISRLTDATLETAYEKMLARFIFINEELIPENDWRQAESLVADIDADDVDFVAWAMHRKGVL